ncbi:MAG: flagellar assembly protein FliX [Magnetovibrionaceae bacterium]
MKVSGPGGAKGVGPARGKEKSASSPNGAFARELEGAAEAAAAPGFVENQAVTPVEALIALQGVGDATDGRSKGLVIDYGERLLDRLETVRMGLLDGSIPKEQLQDLAQSLRADRKRSDDEKLNEIIEEIELRAEVELAKLTRDL